jgi:hypothetical protein
MRTLTKEERARITDGKHNIQAASQALSGLDRNVVPNFESIEECLADAKLNLHAALQGPSHKHRSDKQ